MKSQVKARQCQIPLTLVLAGIVVSSKSGSLLCSSGSDEGSAAALICLGNILRVRVTRYPRINTH